MLAQKDPLNDLLKVRLLVGYLGEIDQFGWWKTLFYQSASHAFLIPIFPRTGHVAKYHGVAEAARLVHDENLSAGSYHLFRLPEELEHDLHTTLVEAEGQTIQELSLHAKDAALETLRGMGEAPVSPLDGPISLGQIDSLRASNSIAQLAGIYAAAFHRGNKAFPYFSRA
ncbi:BrxE family protein [Agrobacterium tumefaciens]|uniref:BrxE family protein n=1 Tax=Agrobacterium tumefaciens TaxID=358 RepID=UPI003BA1DB2E